MSGKVAVGAGFIAVGSIAVGSGFIAAVGSSILRGHRN